MSNVKQNDGRRKEGTRQRELKHTGSVKPEYGYCFKRTELLGQCFCQHWLMIDYYGDVVITLATWEQLFIEMLGGIECEYLGCEDDDTDDQDGCERRHPPSWHFMIYLYNPSSREEVIRRFESTDFEEVLPKLGDSTEYGSDDSNNHLYPLSSCCFNDFLSHVIDLFDDDTGSFISNSFTSNEDFLETILKHEVNAYYTWYKLNVNCDTDAVDGIGCTHENDRGLPE